MKNLRKILLLILIIPVAMLAALVGYITFYPASTQLRQTLPVGVVFGAGITRSGFPSPALKFRLDKSVELYRGGRIERIMISGRKPEIVVMMLYLKRHGIPAERLLPDYSGDNTALTVLHTGRWMKDNHIKGAAMISQRYHLPRIQLLAFKSGMKNIHMVSAEYQKVSWREKARFIVRETLAFIAVFFQKGRGVS